MPIKVLLGYEYYSEGPDDPTPPIRRRPRSIGASQLFVQQQQK